MIRDTTIEKMIDESFKRIKRSALARKNSNIKKAINKIAKMGIGWDWNNRALSWHGRAWELRHIEFADGKIKYIPTIELSTLSFSVFPHYRQYNTVSHEVAHLVRFHTKIPGTGHDKLWSDIHHAMGGNGLRITNSTWNVWEKLKKSKRAELKRRECIGYEKRIKRIANKVRKSWGL